MIEQAIYFGLGCAAAGLLALAFLPVLWARAVRLTRQRLQLQIPVSMQEILADRDHLRAGFAVEQRKLEQEMDRVRAGKAQDMAELGRRSAQILALSETLATLHADGTMREGEAAQLLRNLEEERGQAGALQIALHDAQVLSERRLHDHEALRGRYDALEASAESSRLTVTALQTRAMGLEMTIEDGQRARAALERRFEAAPSSAAISVRGQGEVALPNDLAGAQERIRRLEIDLQAAVQDAKEREKGIHLQRSLQTERARVDGRSGVEKIEALQAEVAALRGALDAARQGEHGAASDGAPAGDAALRASIHEIGLAVARMVAAEEGASRERDSSALPRRPETGVGAPRLA